MGRKPRGTATPLPIVNKLFTKAAYLGINDTALADRAGVSTPSVIKYKKGQRVPKMFFFNLLVEALDMQLELHEMPRLKHEVLATDPTVVAIFEIQDRIKMTSAELSARSGITQNAISMIRRGTRDVSIAEASALAQAVGARLELVDRT